LLFVAVVVPVVVVPDDVLDAWLVVLVTVDEPVVGAVCTALPVCPEASSSG
jgi:hypothetical protein